MYILGRSIAASRDRGAWLAASPEPVPPACCWQTSRAAVSALPAVPAAKSSDRVEHYVESWILSRDVISGSAQRARQRCIARTLVAALTLAG